MRCPKCWCGEDAVYYFALNGEVEYACGEPAHGMAAEQMLKVIASE